MGTEPTRSDRELFDAWAAGDPQAGSSLIERHYDAVVRFFRTKAAGAVDDLVQRTFLRCSEARERFRGDAPFKSFLFGIARNVAFEHIRSRIRERNHAPDFSVSSLHDLDPGLATMVAGREDQRLLVAALHRLPLDLQLALELYYWEGLGVADLAAVLEVPPGTVKSRLHRARRLLREAIEALPMGVDARKSVRDEFADWLRSAKDERQGSPTPSAEG